MDKPKFIQGIVIGAIAGGLISLLDPTTRNYVKNTAINSSITTKYYLKHPADSFRQLKECYSTWNNNVSQVTNQALTILSQVEETIERMENDAHKKSSEGVQDPH
ncbi:hypothetical protein [Radiobacillus sp. PE A8.2]|uniref:hypothetical protein n=1 Tax=Radiobacillus sp. PE A8.2 TaxID=3380349 RepID=UPI00388DA576